MLACLCACLLDEDEDEDPGRDMDALNEMEKGRKQCLIRDLQKSRIPSGTRDFLDRKNGDSRCKSEDNDFDKEKSPHLTRHIFLQLPRGNMELRENLAKNMSNKVWAKHYKCQQQR